MSAETALALLGFAFVMSISPGPSNILLLTSGVNFGLRRSLPLLFGVSAGFLTMVLLVGLGLGPLLERYRLFQDMLRYVCALYVVWLAVNIAKSRALGGGAGEMASPLGFFPAAALQLLNPKAWTVALIAAVTYVDPTRLSLSLGLLILIFALVNIPAIGLWAVSGAALRAALLKGRRIGVFNIVMAVILVASMLPGLVRV